MHYRVFYFFNNARSIRYQYKRAQIIGHFIKKTVNVFLVSC